MKKSLFAQMTWEEVNDAVLERRVIVVPVGAIEQHGPHLPVNTDNLFATSICEAAAEGAPDHLLCAPPIHFGFNEHNMDFPGTISIKPENFINYCFDVGESFARQGFDRIIWVNSHGSNIPLVQIVARRITNETSALSATTDVFDLVLHGPTAKEVRESRIGGVAHACEFETSIYMHLCPELVRTDKIADEFPPDMSPWVVEDFMASSPIHFMVPHWSQWSVTGVEGAPSLATPEKGRKLFEAAVGNLVEFSRYFRDLKLRQWQDKKARPNNHSE